VNTGECEIWSSSCYHNKIKFTYVCSCIADHSHLLSQKLLTWANSPSYSWAPTERV